jgi:hypothetical protein
LCASLQPYFFLLFAEYKVAGRGFAHAGFQTYLHDSIADSAVIFYPPVLSGWFCRTWCFSRIGLESLNCRVALLCCSGCGCVWLCPGAAVGRYFGARLDTLPLLWLLIIFFAALFAGRAGRVWGLDGRRWRVDRRESLWE